MNLWLYITPKITLLSLHRRLLCRCRFRIFPPHFQNCPQVTGVFMAKESSLRISARANMAGCLSQIWDCQQDPHLRQHNHHQKHPPFRESDTKGTTLRQKGPSLRFLHFLCWKNASALLKIYQLWISCLWLVHSPCFSPWSANWNLCKNLKQSKSSAPQMPLKSCSNFTSNFSSSASIAACTCRLQKRPKHFSLHFELIFEGCSWLIIVEYGLMFFAF